MNMHIIVTRAPQANGSVRRYAYGPYASREEAQRTLKAMRASGFPPVKRQDVEATVVRLVDLGSWDED